MTQILDHRLDLGTPFQPGKRSARIIAPRAQSSASMRIVYLLPVEAAGGAHFGSASAQVRELELASRHDLVFAEPDFAQAPWYADHPLDAQIRQESYFLHSVCPQVERSLGWSGQNVERYLFGFSKSGWGAWSLLLRHPQLFARALAWDAPLMMEKVGKWETPLIFSTQECFAQYCVSSLVGRFGRSLGERSRLCLLGHSLFGQDVTRMHELLTGFGIPHEYDNSLKRKHTWHSGWMSAAVECLLSM